MTQGNPAKKRIPKIPNVRIRKDLYGRIAEFSDDHRNDGEGFSIAALVNAAIERSIDEILGSKAKPISSGLHRRKREVEELLAYMDGPPDEEEDLIRGLVRVRAKNAARRGSHQKLQGHGQ